MRAMHLWTVAALALAISACNDDTPSQPNPPPPTSRQPDAAGNGTPKVAASNPAGRPKAAEESGVGNKPAAGDDRNPVAALGAIQLKNKILGKWVSTETASANGFTVAAKQTVEFAEDGKLLRTVQTTVNGNAQPVQKVPDGTYKVLSEREIEYHFGKAVSKWNIVMNGDEFSYDGFLGEDGKPVTYQRVK